MPRGLAEQDEPLTRRDLQDELQRFAKGELHDALRETLDHEALAKKLLEQLQKGFPRASSCFSEKNSFSAPSEGLGKRKSCRLRPGRSVYQPVEGGPRNFPSRDAADSQAQSPKRSPSPGKVNLHMMARWTELDSRNIASYISNNEPLAPGSEAEPSDAVRISMGWRIRLKRVVKSIRFEQFSGFIVILNAIALGYDTDCMVSHPDHNQMLLIRVSELFFCIIFSIELCLRILADGCWAFFTSGSYKSNIFDATLVVVQISEQLLLFWGEVQSTQAHVGVLRLFRLLRVARIARLLRAFHLFDELRVIIVSMGNSLTALGWSVILLLTVVYVASLLFLQIIVAAGETEHKEEIDYWFASLSRTFLTMFECVVGGVDWDVVISPIIADISPAMAFIFCSYISMCLFAMMNLLTGVFVDKAMTSVREDKDLVSAKRIKDLFLTNDSTEDGHVEQTDEITWEVFQEKLQTDAMMDYFAQLNLEVSEARSLFELMDEDGSGSLDSHEIVRACLQLRGPARALELQMLMKDMHDLQKQVEEIHARVI